MLKKIYNKFRNQLPASSKVALSKVVFKLTNKPFYDSSNKIELPKGVVVISADFELAWAWRYSKRKIDPIKMAKQERVNFPLILNKLNELEIPITWATVGHLFLDTCEKKNGKAHSQMPRPHYFENEFWKYDRGDWYDIDPCGNYKTHPEFYAPDLIEMILKSKVNHEIGCHSFSHCDFSEENSYPELIEAELSECQKVADKFGVKFESFVFPGNFHGHFSLLEKHGYSVIRYKSNDMKEIGFPIRVTKNLYAIHDSLAFDLAEEGWDYNYVLWKMKKYVEKAVEKKAIAHFWFHPSIEREQINNYFFPFLEYLRNERDNGNIDIITMKRLASSRYCFFK
jgi:peptidoglycan/xylan/chitin deacetylase (PgdA/CDA1 family)